MTGESIATIFMQSVRGANTTGKLKRMIDNFGSLQTAANASYEELMASINTNRYFIDKFTECPVLGHLAFVNIGEAELKDIADALREISI